MPLFFREILDYYKNPKNSSIIKVLAVLITLFIAPFTVGIIVDIISGDIELHTHLTENKYLFLIYIINALVLVVGIWVMTNYLKHNNDISNQLLQQTIENAMKSEKFIFFNIDGKELPKLVKFSIQGNFLFAKNLIYLYISTFALYTLFILCDSLIDKNIFIGKNIDYYSIVIVFINNVSIFFILKMSFIFSPFNSNHSDFSKNLFNRQIVIFIALFISILLHFYILSNNSQYSNHYLYLSGLCVGVSFNFMISRMYSPYIRTNGIILLMMIFYGTMQTGLAPASIIDNGLFKLIFFTTCLVLKISFMFMVYFLLRDGKILSHIICTNSIDNKLKKDVVTICTIVKSNRKNLQ